MTYREQQTQRRVDRLEGLGFVFEMLPKRGDPNTYEKVYHWKGYRISRAELEKWSFKKWEKMLREINLYRQNISENERD